jgi:hypothetical protein
MGNEEHNIKLLRKTELYELEYDTKYQGRITHESSKTSRGGVACLH